MTWLALRRRRSTFFVFLGLSLVLDFWMVVNGHTSANALSHTGLCQTFACTQPTELYAPARQAVVVDLLLLLLPLGLGLTLGVGLVAGEAERSTNRLVWTQDVTRTRWYVTSLAVSVGIAGVIAAVVLPVAHWWAGVAWVDLPGTLTLGGDRIQPDMFPVSGIVPLAYTVFAVTLGAAVGAVVRRVPWAAAVTVVLYLALAVVMVTTVRQGFAPTGFLVDSTTDSAQYAPWPTPPPWNVGYEYRVIPGVVRGPDAPTRGGVRGLPPLRRAPPGPGRLHAPPGRGGRLRHPVARPLLAPAVGRGPAVCGTRRGPGGRGARRREADPGLTGSNRCRPAGQVADGSR